MVATSIALLTITCVVFGIEIHRAWSAIRRLKDRMDDQERRHAKLYEAIHGAAQKKSLTGLRDLAMRDAYTKRK